MSEIDWSKAPEGATHARDCNREHPDWYKVIDGVLMVKSCGEGAWEESVYSSIDVIRNIQARPTVAWTGAGLPPVGAEVECSYACEDFLNFLKWHEGICIAVGRDPEGREIFVVQCGETLANYGSEAGRVRPRRTQAQIEAEEREAFALNLVTEMGKDPDTHSRSMEQARKIFDLGYRKQGEAK